MSIINYMHLVAFRLALQGGNGYYANEAGRDIALISEVEFLFLRGRIRPRKMACGPHVMVASKCVRCSARAE